MVGDFTAQDAFDFYLNVIPADDPFWSVTIGDPGVQSLFDIFVYYREAMTLQALRQRVGDRRFFRVLRLWITTHRGGNATVQDFIAFAEGIIGQQLDDLFETWLFTPSKPAALAADRLSRSAAAALRSSASPLSVSKLRR